MFQYKKSLITNINSQLDALFTLFNLKKHTKMFTVKENFRISFLPIPDKQGCV